METLSIGLHRHFLTHTQEATAWPDHAETDRDQFAGIHRYIEDSTDPDAVAAAVGDTCDVIWQGLGLSRCRELDRTV
jgi:hypothetical protein